jgi:ribA/ribD-fused uncharacterized protein
MAATTTADPRSSLLVVGFQGKRDPFSNLYLCEFEVDGVKYNSVEQYFQSSKALMFGDTESYTAIMASRDGAKIKRLGRKVRFFDALVWSRAAEDIMRRGLEAKFNMDPTLMFELADTGREALLLECVKSDKYWSAGISKEQLLKEIDTDAPLPETMLYSGTFSPMVRGMVTDPARFESLPGKNVMGRLLAEVRGRHLDRLEARARARAKAEPETDPM